jgi:hypothetical protein
VQNAFKKFVMEMPETKWLLVVDFALIRTQKGVVFLGG